MDVINLRNKNLQTKCQHKTHKGDAKRKNTKTQNKDQKKNNRGGGGGGNEAWIGWISKESPSLCVKNLERRKNDVCGVESEFRQKKN